MVLMRFTDFVIAVPHLPILVILAALDLQQAGFQRGVRSLGRGSLLERVW